MSWPFPTPEELKRYESLRAHGYALLREAHELFIAAVGLRRKG